MDLNDILLILQILVFLLGRILDDISWYSVPVVVNEVYLFEGIGVAAMTINVFLKIFRKRDVQGIFKILFFESQLKFFISWSLVITIAIIFFNVFGCQKDQQTSDYFFIDYTGCCINVVQIFLTNLNYSLLCNTKTKFSELVVYEAILFAEIIFNGNLMIVFIDSLQGVQKDLSILLISLIIANQILIMDLNYRAAYEDVRRLEENEEKKKELQLSVQHKNRIHPSENSNSQFATPNKNS